MTFFIEHLEFLAAVTRMLNTIPESEHYYIHVELREEGTHRKVGAWSDEIAKDAWYFEEVSE